MVTDIPETTDTIEPVSVRAPVRPALWLPTHDGAIHRGTVTRFHVERVDGGFTGGAKSAWTIHVSTTSTPEPVALRLLFTDIDLLCEFVDTVFPGAAFTVLPPGVVTDSPDHRPADHTGPGVRFAVSGGGTGANVAGAIRAILGQLGGGNAYEPDQGYHPPPGAPPRAI